MSVIVPDTVEIDVLNNLFSVPMTIRIYGNDVTPDKDSKTADFTEIVGGGYANKILLVANWTKKAGNPSYAIYSETQEWDFSGVINPPGTIFGYFVTRNTDNKLVWAERFPSAIVPFSPVAGSIIKVLPKFTCQSAF
jgi:hypothetical protein